MRRRRLLVPLVFAVSSLPIGLPAASAPRAACMVWSVDPIGRSGSFFGSIDARSSTDAWAVGLQVRSSGHADPTRPILHHWNGTSWTRTETPREGTLNAVDVRAPDDAWAVGFVGGAHGRVLEQRYEHWDGEAWTVVPPPERRRGVVEDVVAVARDDVWAVGWYRPGPMIRIWHWDGARWSRADAPKVMGRLHAVEMRDDHLVAAGYVSEGRFDRYGLIVLGPDPWRRVPIDGLTDQAGFFYGATGTWVTGYRPAETWTVHRTPDGWTTIPFPQELGGVVDTVAELGPKEVWGFGRRLPDPGSIDEPSTWGVFRWDGTLWTTQPEPAGYEDVPGSLIDATAVPGSASVFVLAGIDAGTVVLRGEMGDDCG
jgi:hypothetical protein